VEAATVVLHPKSQKNDGAVRFGGKSQNTQKPLEDQATADSSLKGESCIAGT
jgi:hypothetical protein